MGGAETAMLETIEALKAAGVSCCVLVPGRGPLNEELNRMGVPNTGLPYAGWMGWGNESFLEKSKLAAKTMVALLPAIIQARRWGCDLVYTNTITIYLGALVAGILRLPHVWHFQEFGFDDHGLVFSFGDKVAWATINRLSSACIANSSAVAAKHRGRLWNPRLHTLYYSMHRFRPAAGDAEATERRSIFRCIIAGALNEGKGQEHAIRAIAILADRGLKVELHILGKGSKAYGELLLKLTKEHHLEDLIKFEGHVSNPASFMQSADALLMCSRCEAFGRVTVEGMLSGKPVIGADTGATAELVRDGFNGYLYRQGNPADLADKIALLAGDPAKARAMGENAKVWAGRQFSKDKHAADLLKILNPLVEDSHQINQPAGERTNMPCKTRPS
jgi:glycosyltransferase involved in cell wall biosynthesis